MPCPPNHSSDHSDKDTLTLYIDLPHGRVLFGPTIDGPHGRVLFSHIPHTPLMSHMAKYYSAMYHTHHWRPTCSSTIWP